MPMSEPLKVSVSPKAMRIEWWISASGGQMKPATSKRHPNAQSVTAHISWRRFITCDLIARMVYILLAPVGRRNLINLICSLSFAVVLRNQLPPFPSLVPSSVIESSVNACVNIQSSIHLRFSERMWAVVIDYGVLCASLRAYKIL